MAAIDKDIDKTLTQLSQKLSQTEQHLDQLIQECEAQGVNVLQILKGAAEELKESHEDLKEEFYELLTPFCQSNYGNIQDFNLSELQEEDFKVNRTSKRKDKLVGLVEDLEEFKKRVDGINERLTELMTDYNIMPKCSGTKESYKRKRPFNITSLANFTREVEEKSEGKGKESGFLSVSDVAIVMYGFPRDIAVDIKKCLGHRMLINFDSDELRFDIEDSDEDDDSQEKYPVELTWVRIKELKQKFEELKKKLYKKQEPDVHGEAEVLGDGDEDPVVSFQRVMSNWIFHIESVLFNSIVYELYCMFAGIETAETIFEDYKAKLKKLTEINHGMVPIIVYKIIYMMENPMGIGFKKHGVVRSGREWLHEKIKLNEVMEQVHKIILRLRSMLAMSDLSYTHIAREDESVSCENMLKQSEEEVRKIQDELRRLGICI